jgi:hypothetical protein
MSDNRHGWKASSGAHLATRSGIKPKIMAIPFSRTPAERLADPGSRELLDIGPRVYQSSGFPQYVLFLSTSLMLYDYHWQPESLCAQGT